ncbi:CheF family chemotaxis protein [Halanaeroarchaeum sulfurireducens]|uniref:Taxis protein CheF n=1 Tax=Halanaeroarchaeum sulfurireducens TaxID=1604004 RepID=A0A0F7PET8_9EURY|nr:CheF family chemotaxis protein [Halanaeroarchaeum sulfurireducens]AKH97843.1 chemotaxis protein CheF1 [Halanaeroarchaeum sulfurireducens]ALG82237.1 chemotaxis protein CheF1 [Halanaeroarchaeum sulfurireducens]
MSESEYKIEDAKGKFLQAVKQGRKLQDADWTPGRIILSNKRIILLSNDGKRTIPLSKIASLSGRYDVNQTVAKVSDYISLSLETESVILLSLGSDTEAFEFQLFGAMLDQEEVRVKHPAVEGGVVQDTDYERARVKVSDGEEKELNVALSSGSFVPIDLDDVGSVDTGKQNVDGQSQPILKVEHSQEGTSVQSYFAGESHAMAVLESLFKRGVEQTQGSVDLSETEKRVLMGLYSGVSPFEIPDFLGMDVDEVEEIYERLIELDVLEEVRTRREVAMKTRGRNIASEVINEE